MSYQSLVDFQYWTFIAQICNLFIQIFLFKKFLFKPVKKILEQRKEEVGTLYDLAEEAKSMAEKDKADYEAKLQQAQSEAEAIVHDATERANRRSDEILGEASEKVAAMMQKADRDIAQERKKAVNEMKNDISDMAIEIAGRIVEKEIRPEDHESLIASFIENMGDEA